MSAALNNILRAILLGIALAAFIGSDRLITFKANQQLYIILDPMKCISSCLKYTNNSDFHKIDFMPCFKYYSRMFHAYFFNL
jgi:hypothetical protein